MQETPATDQNERKSGRRIVALSLVAMLVAAGVLGTMWSRSRQLGAEKAQTSFLKQPVLTKSQQDAHLAKVTYLRDKWRGWALQNKDVLQRLLEAKPDDQAALVAAIKALPEDVDDAKGAFTNWDLIPTNDLPAADKAGIPMFTWNLTDKGNLLKDKMAAERVRRHFSTLRDIEISTSMNVGRSRFSLWASGRVTKETLVDRTFFTTENGQRIKNVDSVDGPSKEILPPYDFLKPTTRISKKD